MYVSGTVDGNGIALTFQSIQISISLFSQYVRFVLTDCTHLSAPQTLHSNDNRFAQFKRNAHT